MILSGKTSVVALLLLITVNSYTQHFDRAAEELFKIRNAYSGSGYNSFTAQYRYAMEDAPGKILDTLTAYIKTKGRYYYCKMDKMEFIQNDSINVAVYHNEKMIVLTNPAAGAEKGRLVIDNWDSSFIAANTDSVMLTDGKTLRTLYFYFTPGSSYSSGTITYNRKDYRPLKISYTQRATQNHAPGKNKPSGIIITVLFSAHSKAAFKDMTFDHSRFVKKQNNKWATVATYNSYSVVNNVYVE
ncbi:hypothetical protein [Agriterribacter sp.]|uniref:hypothetical protein n=1 Tax=Agriterribacter sp. TaxID=2821509 RepID=UPI002BA3A08B|nr:hypothetical protein [Agriterribacter sp.]HRP55600.1 hypothetical protein [Agriterribacter sp.]